MALKVVQSSLIRQVKSMGASVGAPELQEEAIKWIQACSTSSTPNQMSDLNVILFDSHSDAMAKKLLERRVNKVFLLEGSQGNAEKQKENVENLEEKYEASTISALHASMTNILSPSKSVEVNVPFWHKLVYSNEPKIVYKNYPSPERARKKIVMFGCLPFPTQQRALLNSLLEQILTYYDCTKETTKKTKAVASYFQFDSFSLITFLHTSHIARLFSAPLNSPELSFYGRSHRAFSYLFHSLFNVQQLSIGKGYDLSQFHPEIPMSPLSSYTKQLHSLGYDENQFYPVKIEPKEMAQLPGDVFPSFQIPKNADQEMIEKRRQVITFAFWLLIAGKNPQQMKHTWDALELQTTPNFKTIANYASLFPEIRENLELIFAEELISYRRALSKNKTYENCVD